MKFLYTVFAFLLLTFSLHAADFAVVDYQAVIQKSKAFASFQAQAEANKKALETQFQKESEALKAEEQSLVNKRPELSEAEFNKKRADFEAKVTAFRNKYQQKQTDFEKNNNEVLKTIEAQLRKSINEIAKARNLEVVYNSMALAYFDSSKDISDEILKKLDAALPKVSLKKVA
ncbi:MAG: OmpH family outer membrane protein [Alphaproteobacteria bacterium]|jgi:outer membrane protein|nr:OmpH family outer membrane protein [Alphaproteobacteria bacterium]